MKTTKITYDQFRYIMQRDGVGVLDVLSGQLFSMSITTHSVSLYHGGEVIVNIGEDFTFDAISAYAAIAVSDGDTRHYELKPLYTDKWKTNLRVRQALSNRTNNNSNEN